VVESQELLLLKLCRYIIVKMINGLNTWQLTEYCNEMIDRKSRISYLFFAYLKEKMFKTLAAGLTQLRLLNYPSECICLCLLETRQSLS
jgi:hypothetical protein